MLVSTAHASQIVLNTPVPKTMIPINVTHTAIMTPQLHTCLLNPNLPVHSDAPAVVTKLPTAFTPLRRTLSSLVSFFAATYESTFGFTDGPPLHDALTIAYVALPALFSSKRYRVDVELEGKHTVGETVVDVWDYQNCNASSWGADGKNCSVARSLDVRIVAVSFEIAILIHVSPHRLKASSSSSLIALASAMLRRR